MAEDHYSLSAKVFHSIREDILNGKYQANEELKEKNIGDDRGVSRTPVREALRQLELEGLVLMIPRKGAEVAEITRKNMMDVLEVRKALEELAAELACERIGKEQIAEMRVAAKEFERTLKTGDVTQIAEADEKFHDILYIATNNQRLILLLNNLREQMYRLRVEHLKLKECYPQLLAEHDIIIDCVEKRNKEAAKDIVRRHIDYQAKSVGYVLEEK